MKINAQLFLLLFCLLVCSWTGASAADLKPFIFENDFETGVPLEVKPLLANGKYKVNFTGITEEASFAGKKSFKLEITAETGNFYVWLIPFKVSTEGKLQLSFRYNVKASGKGRFGPGVSFCFPAIPFEEQTQMFDWKNSTDGGWERLTYNLAAVAKGRMIGEAWNVNDDDLLGYVQGMVLVMSGVSTGETVTVYLDDLSIKGEMLEMTASFNQQAEARWKPAKERHLKKIDEMAREINADRAFLSACTNLPPAGTFFRTVVETNLSVCQSMLESARKRGYIQKKEVTACAEARGRVNDLLTGIAGLSALETQRRNVPEGKLMKFWRRFRQK